MKRIEPTIVGKVIQTVDGFAKVYKALQQQIVLRGQSKSTLENYIRLVGQNQRAIVLPSLKEEFKLPVILNRSELRELFKAPALLKHRIVLTLIYSAGVRSQEAINLKITQPPSTPPHSPLDTFIR